MPPGSALLSGDLSREKLRAQSHHNSPTSAPSLKTVILLTQASIQVPPSPALSLLASQHDVLSSCASAHSISWAPHATQADSLALDTSLPS